jgi:integrase
MTNYPIEIETALRSQPHSGPLGHVFRGVTPDQVTVTFRCLCRRLEIINFRFHDLRHTAASWLRMSGADIHTVAQLLGHKDLRMAARYQHLSPAFLAEAVNRLDGVFWISESPERLNLRDYSVTGLLAETVS